MVCIQNFGMQTIGTKQFLCLNEGILVLLQM